MRAPSQGLRTTRHVGRARERIHSAEVAHRIFGTQRAPERERGGVLFRRRRGSIFDGPPFRHTDDDQQLRDALGSGCLDQVTGQKNPTPP